MSTNRRQLEPSVTDRLAQRIAATKLGRKTAQYLAELRTRRVPLHWTNMFGVVSAACLLVIFVTGFFLMFFYTPSTASVVYKGSYSPLHGATVSEAYNSTLAISFELRGGLLIRQAHHWAALLLPASLILQMLVMFFTGAFRSPRRKNWVLLFSLLLVALVGGWSGYALPDDMLSGTGLRIVEGIVLSIPFVGTWLSSLLFGGQFPGQVIDHLYPIHIVVVPLLAMVLLAVRLRAASREKPPQFPGAGRAENNVVGISVWPGAATRAAGLLMIVMGLLFFVSAFFTVSPIWLSGPSSPGDAASGSQPDWYTGFLDGALRLVPPGWEINWLDHTWTLALLIPLAVIGVFLGAVVLYPFFEQWISGDDDDHNLLDRPRNTPSRTGLGVAAITFYGSLWGAGSADIVAVQFQLSLESVIFFFRCLVIVGPFIAFIVTQRVCLALQKKDLETLSHGYETGRIVRLPGGEYIEVHQPVASYERPGLVNTSQRMALRAHPDAHGHIGPVTRFRAALSRFFFENRSARTDQHDGQPGVKSLDWIDDPTTLKEPANRDH